MATCLTCEAPTRELWPPDSPAPAFTELDVGNWIRLARFPVCGVLWTESPYEPYASFRYWVRWDYSAGAWRRLHDRDAGATLCQWHAARIGETYRGLSPDDRARVDAHVERAYGWPPWEGKQVPDPAALLAEA